jgi:hypothetical protein
MQVPFILKARRAEAAGAIGILFINGTDDFCLVVRFPATTDWKLRVVALTFMFSADSKCYNCSQLLVYIL